jgi:amphi-Trp domain-containing protein
MVKKEKLFKSKEWKTREEVGQFLKELADKFLTGSVSLIQGEEEINLQISQNVELDVEVEQKDKGPKGIQQELEIELKWYEGDEGPKKSIEVKG